MPLPHWCDDSCTCPDHGTALLYHRPTDDHACNDEACRFYRGGWPDLGDVIPTLFPRSSRQVAYHPSTAAAVLESLASGGRDEQPPPAPAEITDVQLLDLLADNGVPMSRACELCDERPASGQAQVDPFKLNPASPLTITCFGACDECISTVLWGEDWSAPFGRAVGSSALLSLLIAYKRHFTGEVV